MPNIMLRVMKSKAILADSQVHLVLTKTFESSWPFISLGSLSSHQTGSDVTVKVSELRKD